MPPKRSAPSKVSGTEPKRQRKMLTIVEKVQLLDMLKHGRSFAAVGRHYEYPLEFYMLLKLRMFKSIGSVYKSVGKVNRSVGKVNKRLL